MVDDVVVTDVGTISSLCVCMVCTVSTVPISASDECSGVTLVGPGVVVGDCTGLVSGVCAVCVGAKLNVMVSLVVVNDSAVVVDGANAKVGCSVVDSDIPDVASPFSVLVGTYVHEAFCVVVGIYVHEDCCEGSKENAMLLVVDGMNVNEAAVLEAPVFCISFCTAA